MYARQGPMDTHLIETLAHTRCRGQLKVDGVSRLQSYIHAQNTVMQLDSSNAYRWLIVYITKKCFAY